MTLLSDPRDASNRRGGFAAGDLTDAELLAAVRAGDVAAYATLYELHADSIRRLARRLCRDSYEADDVVSEVFANTLRAIQHGGGPCDEFALYALRAVRNTVAKLRTRTDTAHATPSELDLLDRADTRDPFHLAGDVELAFAELPERFQQVLWTTAVEGHTPTELAQLGADSSDGLDAGAVASLSQRARKALGRSYLQVRTSRPARHPDCTRVRRYLPGYVQRTAGAGTAQRIEAHLARCSDCSQVRDEMRELNGKLRTIPWLALLAAAIRRAAAGVATLSAPAAATAAAPVVAIAIAGTMVAVRHDTSPRERAAAVYADADPLASPTPTPSGAQADGGSPDPRPAPRSGSGAGPEDGPTDVPTAGPMATDPPPGPVPTVPLGGPHDGTDVTGVGDPLVDPIIDHAGVAGPVTTGVPVGGVVVGGVVGSAVGGVSAGVAPAVGTGVDTLLDDVSGTVDDVGAVVGALPGGLPAVLTETGNLVVGVGETVDHSIGTVTNVTETATDTVTATVTTLAATVDEVGADVVDIVTVDPDAPVTELVDDVGGPGGLLDDVVGGVVGTQPPSTPICLPLVGCLP